MRLQVDKLDPSVLLPPLRRRVIGDRLLLAPPHGQQPLRCQPVLLDQILSDAARPSLREAEVVRVAAHTVRMPLDLQAGAGELGRLERLGDRPEGVRGLGQDVGGV
jgi:hypothetical protein